MSFKGERTGLKGRHRLSRSLTRHWATELWDRVGQLIGSGDICHQSWKISDLTGGPRLSRTQCRRQREADVLVCRSATPENCHCYLHVWIDAWLPRRAGRAGALVALIGVPPQPDAQSGRAYHYLEAVARRAGLDFLPRERKLPEEPSGCLPASSKSAHRPTATVPWSEERLASDPRRLCTGDSASERARRRRSIICGRCAPEARWAS